MALDALNLVHASLSALKGEADQAQENKEALLGLARKTEDVVWPQLHAVEAKLAKSADEPHLVPALSQLCTTLRHVRDIVTRRGRNRSVLRLPVDAVRGRAAKIKAELEGAEQSLMGAIQLVAIGLQIEANGSMQDLHRKFDALMKRLQASEDPSGGGQGQEHPWALDFASLSYEMTGRGKPKKVIGKGGFGVVFRATLTGKDGKEREVAVKEPYDASQDLESAFLQEAKALHRLRHRNVVKFVGGVVRDKTGDPCYMLVYEILAVTLKDHLPSLGSDGGRKRRLILDMAEGLAYLHSMRIVHRDIKPENIMISSTDGRETAKYIDFGLSKEWETLTTSRSKTAVVGTPGWMSPEKDFGLSKEWETLTTSRSKTAVVGTPGWMSPEKMRGETSTAASDVFSFGLVGLYVLASGGTPPSTQAERVRMVRASGHGDGICGRLILCCTVDDKWCRPTSATVATSLVIGVDTFNAGAGQPSPTTPAVAVVHPRRVSQASGSHSDWQQKMEGFRDNGDCSGIIQLMRQHEADEGVQEQGCRALADLSENNDENRVKVAAGGGIEAVVGG
eukprot:CAMPEP_0184326158 /NCGR_PEP_ID=MMETSP1049-20130417/142415_1 /TAXON_ID=77928 /ORGANISM="Proteomonas sulcata, Strain CCMP704" /LENGTH=563 /DNA_ID=CAMNT_0026648335 /DNA_START=185 /DNA_END=1872 /DNA_ORIENTATION=+